jgi:hypothetical protein
VVEPRAPVARPAGVGEIVIPANAVLVFAKDAD